ncbi:HK97-gp10 family putative phage morphogenesis protein [Brevundimonas vesicularis]|uniref:HK97 gp10 family phage protein n=1 Tax=Brevundimonas vesicularis TaxID=41276 RepID=A0A1Z3U5E5_BREVE|nr:HK97-gp10 family putative phage morphogenesis protein [Brevundimonas vesicularis]ASE38471.1 hypothetical protein CEP68_02535 [Brevundimonas vesicularis]
MAASGFRAGDRERARAKFRALPKAVRQNVETALEQNAEDLSAAIKRRVPVEYGDLQKSVTWKKGAASSKSRDQGSDPDLTVRVVEGDKDAFYAPFVEYGTADAPAQPHFFPTYRSMRRRLKSRLSRAVSKAIKEAGA